MVDRSTNQSGPPGAIDGSGGAERISAASEKALEKALRRYAAVQRLRSGDPKATRESVAHEFDVSPRTLDNWEEWERSRGGGASALVDRPRGGRGETRIRGDGLPQFIRETGLQLMRVSGSEIPPVAATLDRVKIVAGERGWQVPSRYAVRRLLWSIPRAERIYAAKGPEGYFRDVSSKPEVHRADGPNEVLVTDHVKMHVRVRDGESQFRPDMTVVLDRWCGSVLGFCLSRQGNSTTVGLALRMSILPKPEDPEGILFGVPKRVYHDRGRDFLGHHVQAVLADLGIESQPTIGRSPYSKGDVESFFSTLNRTFVRYLPGYVGDRPTEKPMKTNAVLSIDELRDYLRAWCFHHYNHLAFHRRRLAGKRVSRLEWRRSVKFDPRLPKEADLLHLLLKRALRQVGEGGIRLGGMFTYWNDALIPLAEERVKVECRFDPGDLSKIVVYYRNEFFCWAYDARALAAQATEETVKERMHLRKERKAAVAALVDPALEAAEQGGDVFLSYLERKKQDSAQVAAVGGGRPRAIHMLLPKEASARRRTLGKGAPPRVGVAPKSSKDTYDPFAEG